MHAPYLSGSPLPDGTLRHQIAATLQDPGEIQEAVPGIDLRLEFKLGRDREPGILGAVMTGVWSAADLAGFCLCLDVGDWLMAARTLGVDPMTALGPWRAHVRMIHAHVPDIGPDAYTWAPIHPDAAAAPQVVELCREVLARVADLHIVFEHLPQAAGRPTHALAGARWLKDALERAG